MSEQGPEPDLRLEMFSRPQLLAAARSMVGNVAQRIGFDQVQCGQVSLAVDEALCNIINHGYERREDGRIWVKVWTIGGDEPAIRIVVEDLARQVDPETIRSRDLEDVRPGGLGVFIIKEVMDEVSYERRREGGMRLTMLKHVRRADDGARAEADGTGKRASA